MACQSCINPYFCYLVLRYVTTKCRDPPFYDLVYRLTPLGRSLEGRWEAKEYGEKLGKGKRRKRVTATGG